MLITILLALIFLGLVAYVGFKRAESKQRRAEMEYELKRHRILTEAAFILHADFRELDEILNTRGITHG